MTSETETTVPDKQSEADAKEKAAEEALAILARVKQGTFTKRQAKERAQQFVNLLSEVDDETFKLILADDEVQSLTQKMQLMSGDKPGDPIFDDKGREISRVPWSAEYMQEIYPMVEWTPMRTENISVNGVTWRVWEGIPCKTPNIIRDVAQESYRMTRAANDMQMSILQETAPVDGVTLHAGWRKLTNEELEAQPGNRTV